MLHKHIHEKGENVIFKVNFNLYLRLKKIFYALKTRKESTGHLLLHYQLVDIAATIIEETLEK